MIQDKIFRYFDGSPDLHVLFVFDQMGMLQAEIADCTWPADYRIVPFEGQWFTVKYNLDNDWQYDKVILMFHQPSPLAKKSLQATFPLMDLLVANMEYHSQDYAAFIQRPFPWMSATGDFSPAI